MRPVEIEIKIKSIRRELECWQGILANKACNTCKNFGPACGCQLADGLVPPAEVQKTGCPEWQWDQIPF